VLVCCVAATVPQFQGFGPVFLKGVCSGLTAAGSIKLARAVTASAAHVSIITAPVSVLEYQATMAVERSASASLVGRGRSGVAVESPTDTVLTTLPSARGGVEDAARLRRIAVELGFTAHSFWNGAAGLRTPCKDVERAEVCPWAVVLVSISCAGDAVVSMLCW
jgi:hypothetical protein